MQLTFGYRHYDADIENTYDEYRTGITYRFAEPIWSASWTTSLEIGYRNYEEFVTTLDGRRDRMATLHVTAVFDDITYFGFSPSIDLSAKRIQSSAETYTTSAVGVSLGITSNF